MLPPSARFSSSNFVGSYVGGRGEISLFVARAPIPVMLELGQFRQAFSFGSEQFSHGRSQLMDVPPMNGAHHRAQSDSHGLPNKVRFGSGPIVVALHMSQRCLRIMLMGMKKIS